jgi:predicted RNase H-like HicB family nuclease
MKGIKALRCVVKINQVWESPMLHILITKEDNVYVARCLDFTVSSHGETVADAMEAVKAAIVEYVRYALENNKTEQIIDPAAARYWALFNQLELKAGKSRIKQSASKINLAVFQSAQELPAEMIVYA